MSSEKLRAPISAGRLLVGALALSLIPANGFAAQYSGGQGSQQQPPKQNPTPPTGEKGGTTNLPPGTPPEQPLVNKEEDDAAKAIIAMKPDQSPQLIQAAGEFLKKYPQSRFRPVVYFRMAEAYRETNNFEKLTATGDEALVENPDNVDVLALMCWFLPHKVDRNSLDAERKLSNAEKYGRRALELMATLPKPDIISEADFALAKHQKEAMAHSGLGLVYYHRGKTADMVAEFEQSTTLDTSPDPLDYFLLGNGRTQMKKFTEAAAAYEKCSQVNWAWQADCKTRLEATKKLASTQPSLTAPKP